MSSPRHFLSLLDLSPRELCQIIERALEAKRKPARPPANGVVLGMLFDKPSTRTRLSFEIGVRQLGGDAVFLSAGDTQLSRGETPEDSARVMASMLDAIVLRTAEHEFVERFAAHSKVPVINGLTRRFHPCQLLADMLTYRELRGPVQGKVVAWLGDGNNVCHSYINAARQFDFELRVSCPMGREPDEHLLAASRSRATIVRDPLEAAKGANLLVTDVWASMGDDARDTSDLRPYQLNGEKLALAASDALCMHCLPAHRGEEISAELLDSPDGVFWLEAENRMHAQKALLELLLGWM